MKVPPSVATPFGRYTVTRVANLTYQGEPANGSCKSDERLIHLDRSLRGFLLRETLAHEWLHACVFDGGFDGLLGDPLHEALVSYLARCIARYLPPI